VATLEVAGKRSPPLTSVVPQAQPESSASPTTEKKEEEEEGPSSEAELEGLSDKYFEALRKKRLP
jgi:hypothetical protein